MNTIKEFITNQTFVTVISGVLVFVLTQLYTEFCLRPMQEYKNLKGKIAKALVLYANLYANPIKNMIGENSHYWREAEDEVRNLAAEVEAFAEIKPVRFLAPSIPNRYKLKEASRSLIGLSNSFIYEYCSMTIRNGVNYAHEVENILGIDKLPLKTRIVKRFKEKFGRKIK